jgi:asparagine synthase (glutamine-hydrolysing)
MCGIFGFAGFSDPDLPARMAASLRHRGPDGEGFYRDEPHRFFMGARRLAIIDLAGGGQPLFNEDRSLAVCANGEIYNHLELRDELTARGHHFATRCDTEVLVHAYEEWGADCVTHFNGMFAFALHNARTGETFCARDRSGQKPFYYHHRNGRFLFASEVKAILQCTAVPRACHLPAIDAYLALRYVPEPVTLFEGIFTLPAAHTLRHSADGTVRLERYWEIPLGAAAPSSDAVALEETERLLREAVRLTLRSDVPVGGYLSAGVDSSVLVALMTEHHNRVNTYAIGFGAPGDETRAAAETARLLGTNHHEVTCRAEDFDRLPEIVHAMDRPVGDALIVAFDKLAEVAARDVKVVLSGEGADEIFAGYSFHNVIQLTEWYHRVVPGFLHRRVAMPILQTLPVELLNTFFVFPAHLGESGKARVVDFLDAYAARSLVENSLALRTLWPRPAREALYTAPYKALAAEVWIPPVSDTPGPFLDRLLKLQWNDWLPDWCAIRQDKNAMAHSLEVRMPFLDNRLIEQAFRLPPRLKNNGLRDKILERRIARKVLPPEVACRKKNPFFLPMEFFFEHPQIQCLIAETLNESQIRRRGYFEPTVVRALLDRLPTREFVVLKQVMALVILELWHRAFLDHPTP